MKQLSIINYQFSTIMAVPYKKIMRKDPRKADAVAKFYPQLVTLGQSIDLDGIAHIMVEASSLSEGDILSVLKNFVKAMRSSLYSGQSVNIRDFGVFSLSARTVGTETEKDCTAKSIRSVRINFRPSSSVRPNLTATRAGERIEFLDIKAALENNGGSDGGGGNEGGGGDIIDPTA